MHASAQLKSLRRVLEALVAVVDQDGFCYGNASLVKMGAHIDMDPATVRRYLRALEGLRVVKADLARALRQPAGMVNQPRLRFQLLKPDAVIEERGGFFCLQESDGEGR